MYVMPNLACRPCRQHELHDFKGFEALSQPPPQQQQQQQQQQYGPAGQYGSSPAEMQAGGAAGEPPNQLML
jgi:hypothetical protein